MRYFREMNHIYTIFIVEIVAILIVTTTSHLYLIYKLSLVSGVCIIDGTRQLKKSALQSMLSDTQG